MLETLYFMLETLYFMLETLYFMFLNFPFMCQNSSVCLKLSRPWLVIVYCYIGDMLKSAIWTPRNKLKTHEVLSVASNQKKKASLLKEFQNVRLDT